jgi:ribosome biogenesis GTPase
VFCRPGASGQLKPVAANIDLVLVVLAPRPEPFLNLLDRYLVAVENLSLKPLIVINKSDLRDTEPVPVIDTVLEDYPALGYDVLEISAHAGLGLGRLKAALAGKTTVVVGQSGVGKSSLVNALSTEISARVGGLSGGAGKGTHTTTAAQLFHLDGFNLIDSPGIREFGLWHISPAQLLDGFVEFRPYLGQCKFRDCSHNNEPGCALRAAVATGAIQAYRLENCFQILASLQAV